MEPITLLHPTQDYHLLKSLVLLHQICITTPPHVCATFLPPLDTPLMTSWWQDRFKEVSSSQRLIFIQKAKNQETEEEEVAGVVMLGMPMSQTGPFRGAVEKLLVSPNYRRKGIAYSLMKKLEEVAKEKGRTLLILDTEKGSPAELVYPKMGYIKFGELPNDMIRPFDGALKTGILFYKDLRLN